jgi:DNA-binding transcriptional regulator YbjK
MKISSVILVSAAVVALGIGGLHLFDSLRTRAPATAPAAAAPESLPMTGDPIATGDPAASDDPAAVLPDQGALEPVDPQQLALAIERALVAADPQQRETAFAQMLPALLASEPQRAVEMLTRQQPGEARDALREEVTRQWIQRDPAAAMEWMRSLEDAERRASATTAMRVLAAHAPEQAIELAGEFGVGLDDGSLEHLVQIWATEQPEEARRWIEAQPENARTAQLRARIEQVLAQRNGAP